MSKGFGTTVGRIEFGLRRENVALHQQKEAALEVARMTAFSGGQYAEQVRELEARCASLEALVRGLAKGVIAVRDLMAESGGVYGLHLNGDPSPWDELTEGGRFEEWLTDYSAAESALSHPLVSELTGMKEDGE